MKVQRYFAILLLLYCMFHVHAKCCYSTKVSFGWSEDSMPFKCADIDGAVGAFRQCEKWKWRTHMVCHVLVCGDGRLPGGSYCGKGPCNIFGCNCDGGCIEGDPEENFIKLKKEIGWKGIMLWKEMCPRTYDYHQKYVA